MSLLPKEVLSTKIVPVYRKESRDKFIAIMNNAELRTVQTSPGHVIATAPIKNGQRFDLLGIGYDEALHAMGVGDYTDHVGEACVSALIFEIASGQRIRYELNEEERKLLKFQPAFPGSTMRMKLQREIVIKITPSREMRDLAGDRIIFDAPKRKEMAEAKMGREFEIAMDLQGEIQTETGTTGVLGTNCRVTKVTRADGVEEDVLEYAAEFHYLGYELDVERANNNRKPVAVKDMPESA